MRDLKALVFLFPKKKTLSNIYFNKQTKSISKLSMEKGKGKSKVMCCS